MTQEIMIKKISDYILQNANTINVSGLYNGKAGLALALFVASRQIQDDYIENKAYNLLMEALVDINHDTSFEKGQAGIGYVLSYLIQNRYLEADFDVIFREQYKSIIKSLDNINNDPMKLLNSFKVIYFLTNVSPFKMNDNDHIQMIISNIFQGVEMFLTTQFFDFTDIDYVNNKLSVLNTYKIYLALINYSGYTKFSYSILDDYTTLYRNRKIASSLEIGYYLKEIANKCKINGYDDVIHGNIANSIKNIRPQTLTIREQIDTAKLIRNCNEELMEPFVPIFETDTVNDLLKTLNKNAMLGYGNGLGRFLIYCIDKDIELL